MEIFVFVIEWSCSCKDTFKWYTNQRAEKTYAIFRWGGE